MKLTKHEDKLRNLKAAFFDIRRRVERVVEKQTGRGENGYLDERLKEFDWIDQIQLACDLEDEFDVTVLDSELATRLSVSGICEYVESLVTAKEV